MPDPTLPAEMTELLAAIRQHASVALSMQSLQENIVQAIPEQLPYCNWTGFYMLDPTDPETLILGPFVGAATPHARIPVSQGICGAAVASGKSVIVDDVHAERRYSSCSIETKSEIVVPIYANGLVIGEIDIDSHSPAAFTNTDREFLEEAARIVGAYVEQHAEDSKSNPPRDS
jgi:L-methionine (R)-S-oxide reductase